MNSKRLEAIASFIDKEDIVLDVGCDHGYLDIYLVKNNLCDKVYASDISINALNSAKENFKKEKVKIDSFLSDGFISIPVKFNTAVISGVGTATIIGILSQGILPNKLVLSSHNDLYELRKFLNKIGYIIEQEKVIKENDHYYVIMKSIKGKQRLKYSYLRFGISKDTSYYKYLYDKNKEILKRVPFIKKIELYRDNYLLNRLIKKSRIISTF